MRLKQLSWSVLSSICIFSVIVVLVFSSFLPEIRRRNQADAKTGEVFSWHLKLLTEHGDDPFWRAVVAEATSAAILNDCLVEEFPEDYYRRYGLAELIDIAVLQEVDAILIEADQSEAVAAALERAHEKGIWVITLLGDAPDSGRDVSIAVNNYQLGRQYGEAILGLDDVETVTVLLSEISNARQELIYSSISETLTQSGIAVSARVVRGDSFSSEREIHSILTLETPRPDVLLCLNAEDSLRAAQILVDYNAVGQIAVIGYYDAAEILQAVGKGILHATVSLDAASVGLAAVESFLNLERYGRASEYQVIQTRMIDARNYKELLNDAVNWHTDDREEGSE